jgi:hypothetical protein
VRSSVVSPKAARRGGAISFAAAELLHAERREQRQCERGPEREALVQRDVEERDLLHRLRKRPPLGAREETEERDAAEEPGLAPPRAHQRVRRQREDDRAHRRAVGREVAGRVEEPAARVRERKPRISNTP